MPLQPGDRGCDYSGARPTMGQVKAAGGKFIGRYSAGAFSNAANEQWKLCTTTEIATAVNAGVDVVAISESFTTRVTEGFAAGVADGEGDLAFWKSRGLAQGATVFVCWDAGPVSSKYGAVAAYIRGWNKGAAGYYTAGIYAGNPVIAYLKGRKLIRYGIQPNATSWSNSNLPYAPSDPGALLAQALRASSADLWQTGNYWLDKNADEDIVLRTPCGTHLEALNVKPVVKKPNATQRLANLLSVARHRNKIQDERLAHIRRDVEGLAARVATLEGVKK